MVLDKFAHDDKRLGISSGVGLFLLSCSKNVQRTNRSRIKVRRVRVSEPADETKVNRQEVDVKECYRSRRVHSAGDGGLLDDSQQTLNLYLSRTGPLSQGSESGSASSLVSDLGILLVSGW